MTTEQKPLMIRGDKLLFALNVLARFASHGSTNCLACKDWGDRGCLWLQRMRQIPLVADLADLHIARACYTCSDQHDLALEYVRRCLEHMNPKDGASFEIEAICQMINRSISYVDQYTESKMTFRPRDFLCAIASGELTEADFRA